MHLLQKSKDNRKAAEILMEKGLLAPSVHCSYYFCYQWCIVWLNKNGITYAEQGSLTKGKDSHKITIKEILKKIDVAIDANMFERSMDLVKGFRRMSDYKNESISLKTARMALGNAEFVVKLLK